MLLALIVRLTGVASSAFAASQSVFLFTVGVPIGYLHSSTESRGLSSAELHVQLPVSDSVLEGADRLVLGDILHCVVQSGALLDILSKSFHSAFEHNVATRSNLLLSCTCLQRS